MSTAVEINGLSLIPIKEAASSVSYSRDYVARLAREGKIVASQIGRQWFVDLISLENFSAEASALEEIRRQELRAERKRELMAKESLSALDEVVVRRIRKQRFDAMVVTLSVACLGLLTGVGVYTAALIPGSPLSDITRSLAIVSVPVRPIVSTTSIPKPEMPLPAATEHSTLLLSTVVEQPIFVNESVTEKMADGASGVLVLTPGSDRPSGVAVEELFSDSVVVTFNDTHTGVITYEDSETLKEYPFVLVPDFAEVPQVDTP